MPRLLSGKCAVIPILVYRRASTVLLGAIDHDGFGRLVPVRLARLATHWRIRFNFLAPACRQNLRIGRLQGSFVLLINALGAI